VGAEGSTLQWDVTAGKKLGDGHLTNQPFIAAESMPDATRAFCVTAEKCLKEIILQRIYDPATGVDITPANPREVDVKKVILPQHALSSLSSLGRECVHRRP
jgi:hypothetical protein